MWRSRFIKSKYSRAYLSIGRWWLIRCILHVIISRGMVIIEAAIHDILFLWFLFKFHDTHYLRKKKRDYNFDGPVFFFLTFSNTLLARAGPQVWTPGSWKPPPTCPCLRTVTRSKQDLSVDPSSFSLDPKVSQHRTKSQMQFIFSCVKVWSFPELKKKARIKSHFTNSIRS